MEIDTEVLKIDPKNLGILSQSLFLTLALIRNDLGDIIYLQGLHANKFEGLKIEKVVNATNGQISGRNIYIMRLVLSHFYSFLEFLYKNKSKIISSTQLQSILKKTEEPDQKYWADLILLSEYIFLNKGKTQDFKGEILELAKLCKLARHELTYHYYKSHIYLDIGFSEAFKNHEKSEANEFACITEVNDVHKDRSYYIDLAIQRYLEKEANLSKDLFQTENDLVNILAGVNRVISKIIKLYHEELVVDKK